MVRKAPSEAQVRHRTKFGGIRRLWRTASPAEKATWAIEPETVRSRPRLGQSGTLPPYLVFVKVNTIRATQGLAPVLTRPQPHKFTANPVGKLVSTNTDSVVDLKLSVPTMPATNILVLGAAPCSAGISFVNHFVILGRLPAAEGGYSHITKLYVDRYGVPPVGTRVFIRTRQMCDGWTDFPIQTSALVPAA